MASTPVEGNAQSLLEVEDGLKQWSLSHGGGGQPINELHAVGITSLEKRGCLSELVHLSHD